MHEWRKNYVKKLKYAIIITEIWSGDIMSKINIKVRLSNNDEETITNHQAIIQDNILKYIEDNKIKTTFNYNDNKLIREGNDFKMLYILDNNNPYAEILVKQINKIIKPNIEIEKLERKDNDIHTIFNIEENKIEYHVEEIKWVY